MKSILVILFSLIISNQVNAETHMKKEITDQFKDKVKDVKVVNGNLEIYFSRHAAIYTLKNDHPKFKELQISLEARKSDHKMITVTSIIPKMEIQEITE